MALHKFGVGKLVVCDSTGALHAGRNVGENSAKRWIIENTNEDGERGTLKRVIRGADMFIGVSAPRIVTRRDVENMHKSPIIFALSNPIPEVMPEDVFDLASVIATGRSDYANQINNVLAFPGIFRGALDARASEINDAMKQAAAAAIASVVEEDELSPEYIIPSVFNTNVAKRVAAAVSRTARATRVAHRVPKGASFYEV
jgi:malate dehydrogenase (oxaloacetate-decarboxylating)